MTHISEETQLIDILQIAWKRRWLILLPSLACMLAAAGFSYLRPTSWEVDAIIQPSKFMVETGDGRFDQVLVTDPRQISGQINQSAYEARIAADLSLDNKSLPRVRASVVNGTNLVRIYTRGTDVESQKKVLVALFDQLKKELDKKANIEISGQEAQIKNKEIDIAILEKDTIALQKKLKIVQARTKEIETEMSEVRKRIQSLEKNQLANLKTTDRTESESLALLLYSNEIQANMQYHDTLNELLGSKKSEGEDIKLSIEKNTEQTKQIGNDIAALIERKGRIDHTQLIKEPTQSTNPVSPRRTFIVLISVLFALLFFTILSFLVEYIQQQKPSD